MATTTPASSNGGTLDVQSLVSQLMAIERQPIDKLNTKVTSYQSKISSFGTLKGLASGFQTAVQGLKTSLSGFSATASDTSVFSASAASTAAAGSYSINVTTLAKASKLAAAGQLSDTAPIGAGVSTVRITVGTTDTDIAIAAGATLQDIRTAINAANIGVTATIINAGGGTPYRLALSSNSTGLSNAINKITVLTGGDADINNLLAYNPTENAPAPAPAVPLAQTVAAANADFTINGIQIIKSSNTITDAIDGVTLTLSKEATPATLTVARDTSATRTAAAGFVDAYNALTSQLKSRSAYGNATTAAPVLAGDGTVRIMLDQLRGIFLTGASGGTLTTLSQVGCSTQADGTLKLDSSKLTTAMSNDFADVTNLFSSATGFATRLDTWATSVVQTGGLIDARTTSLNTSITEYNARISKLEVRMTFLQKQYTTTYSRLNSLLASMDNTSAYLTQQFSTSSK
ncbi:MAG: flagellar filament capping protein FliD [Sulfuritalea sp.]|nr:flagellar filament capping protein FliD [Sulfuritalea sp.]